MADIDPITVFRGDTLDIVITVRDSAGELVDISTATEIRWTMTDNVAGTLIAEKTLGAGVEIANSTSFVVALDSADTLAIQGATQDATAYHEATVSTADGGIYTVISGEIISRESNAEVV